MVPSGLVHLQKEKDCEGKHPREWPLKEELGQGTGLGGQMGPWGGAMGGRSPPVLRVSAGEGDAVHGVMAAKEEPVKRSGEVTPEMSPQD